MEAWSRQGVGFNQSHGFAKRRELERRAEELEMCAEK